MFCGTCGHRNGESARFCEQCGTPLGPPAAADPRARPPRPLAQKILSERSALEGERKQITVMFSDIVRSMELAASLDTEGWRAILERFFTIACRAVHDVEGTVHQFTGDGVMALFGAPLAHEDHAQRGCLAALELQSQLEPLSEEVEREHGLEFLVRCGLNSGEVVVGSIGDDLQMDYASIGHTNGLAKRMESIAPAGSTALSASTAALVEGEFEVARLGEFELTGMDEPQPVYKLLGRGPARTRLEAGEARGLSRFVGRVAEEQALEGALERALAGDGRVVGVVGEPGVGKSRLCRELVCSCRDRGLRVDTASAVAYGRAAPLLPVLSMLREFFGIGEDTEPVEARERIAGALIALDPGFEPELPLLFDFLGVPDPDRPLEQIDPEARQRRLLAFVERLVEARSRQEPAMIVIEDLHWIDEASGVFLDRLVRAVGGTRTLLVLTYRPEYEAAWAGSAQYSELVLEPLDETASGELLAELLGDDPSLEGLPELIKRRTAGNPFFIEEAVQALAETGRLSGRRGAYRLAAPLEELVLPPTVQAVLAARIDRLASREKALVQTMSVIGREVPEPVLRAVSSLEKAELEEAIGVLTGAAFLNPARLNGHRGYQFKHPLTQEVAYATQLSKPRARAHAAVAEAIERVYADGLDERAALLAHHSEAAGERLAAARWHARAAGWISASSPAEGMRHWRRVRALTDELASSPEVDGLAVLARISILALAWRLGMGHDQIEAIHAEGQELTGGPGLRSSEAPPESASPSIERTLLNVAYAANLTSEGRVLEGLELYRAASAQAESIGDPGLILNVTVPRAYSAWVAGLLLEGLECADRALAVAGEDVSAGAGLVLGNPYAHILWVRAVCLTDLGRWPAAEAEFERSIQLAREHGDPECECFAYATRPHLHEHLGGEQSLSGAERAVELAGQVGSQKVLAAAYAGLAMASADRGKFEQGADAAERSLSIARPQRMNLELEPETVALLARAKLGLGDVEEARALAEEAVGIADARSLTRQAVVARIALAQVLVAIGDANVAQEASAVLGAASELAGRIGFRASRPNVHRGLAALARLRGDEETAEREEAEAERIVNEIRGFAAQAGGTHSDERVLLDLAYFANLLLGGREKEALEGFRTLSDRVHALGDPGLILTGAVGAAYVESTVGSLRAGVECIDEALSAAGDDIGAGSGLILGNPYAHCLMMRGTCKGDLGELSGARRDFDRAIELGRAYDDPEAESYAFNARARLSAILFDLESASADAERAVAIGERAGNHHALVKAYGAAAIVSSMAGDFTRACNEARKALAMARERGVGLDWEPDILAALAGAQLGLGQVEEAREAAEEAVAIGERRELHGEVWARLALARVLMRDDGSESIAAAEDELKRGLEIATEAGYRASEPSIHLELAELARLRGDEERAKGEVAEAERILAEIKSPAATSLSPAAESMHAPSGHR